MVYNNVMRTKLADRLLPNYSKGEELFNFISHLVGAVFGVIALVLCIVKAYVNGNAAAVVTSIVYGLSVILLYTMSAIYHGLSDGMAKRVMQVMDHCTIFVLIAGTYTPIAVCTLAKVNPWIGWGIFGFEWALALVGIIFNAIDIKYFSKLSMFIMLLMGWAIVPFYKTLLQAVGTGGFWFILSGGIVYSIGAALYAIGNKKTVMHCIFHVFVVVASILQFIAIFFYVL